MKYLRLFESESLYKKIAPTDWSEAISGDRLEFNEYERRKITEIANATKTKGKSKVGRAKVEFDKSRVMVNYYNTVDTPPYVNITIAMSPIRKRLGVSAGIYGVGPSSDRKGGLVLVRPKIYITIIKKEDEWYYIRVIYDESSSSGSNTNSFDYKCDQLDGLLEFLSKYNTINL